MISFFRKINKFSAPKVACVTLSGVIGGGSRVDRGLNVETVLPLLEEAFDKDRFKAVSICVNSPGGSPVQSELIYNAIRDFSVEKGVPVFTFAQDVAASGGYWLLLAGDEVYGHRASIIGSIGVVFSGFGLTKLIKKIGVDRRVYTEGKNKAILDPFLPEDKENIAILKEVQKDIFEGFKEIVLERRKNKLKNGGAQAIYKSSPGKKGKNKENSINFLDEKIFTGAFWSGKTALQLGLIDEIGDYRRVLRKKFGKKVKIVNIEAKKGFLKSILGAKGGFVDAVVAKIEEKGVWGRFGL